MLFIITPIPPPLRRRNWSRYASPPAARKSTESSVGGGSWCSSRRWANELYSIKRLHCFCCRSGGGVHTDPRTDISERSADGSSTDTRVGPVRRRRPSRHACDNLVVSHWVGLPPRGSARFVDPIFFLLIKLWPLPVTRSHYEHVYIFFNTTLHLFLKQNNTKSLTTRYNKFVSEFFSNKN